MADGCEDAIMLRRTQLPDQSAAALPCRAHARHARHRVLGKRRQHHLLLAIEIGARSQRTAVLGTGNRMCRHELPKPLAEMRACGGNHVSLGTAGVGDDGLRAKTGGNARHYLGGRSDGRGNHDEVGVAHLLADVEAGAVKDAEVERLRQRTQASSKTDDLANLPGGLEGERERAADQADAKDDDLAELRGPVHSRRAHCRAITGNPRALPGSGRSLSPCRSSRAATRASRTPQSDARSPHA